MNIFGGIMRCGTIATGVVAAARKCISPVPLVVRMKGTSEDLGKKILVESVFPSSLPTPLGPTRQPDRRHGQVRSV